MKQPEKRPIVDGKKKTIAAAEQGQSNILESIAEGTEHVMPDEGTPISDESRGRGRPATGKRSNPDWKLYSHFLRKKTQRAAVAKLQTEDNGRDLSDVLQELLENWLKG
jgi:hypothetical protein